MSLRIGVIGVGYLGQHHARVFAGIEDVELVGISDMNCNRADEIAGKYSCRSFPGYKDLIEACDALSIVTPTTTHHGIAMDCLKAGKNLFIEKPISERLDEAKEIIDSAEESGLILQVGHLERYNPGVMAVREMVTTPKFIEAERLSPFLGRGIDVDVTVDLMIHDVDIVLSMVCSEVVDIRAAGNSVTTDKIDVAKAWLEFRNGCKALITASRLAPEKIRRLKVHQEDSYISLDYQSQEVRRYFKKSGDVSFDILRPESKEPLKEELKDFVSCVRNKKKPMVSGKEAMDALEIVFRINEIMKTSGGQKN
jgi:predicted dehydrogenase